MRSIREIAGCCAGAMISFATCSSAQQSQGVTDQSHYLKSSDITYAVVDGRELKLDLYLPTDTADPPLLVWVHGGAWQRGSKETVYTTDFVKDGYAIASIEFRNSVDAVFPAQVHDIKAAIRFLRAMAATYGYDATRIGIHGRSSGAHLTALVGVTNGHEGLEGEVGEHLDQSSDVQAIVSYFGASNLNSILDQSTPFGLSERAPALELLLGGPVEERRELAALASPVSHIDAADPPLLILHGDQDPDMPINQSHELRGAYKRHGLPVHFEVIHGAGHGGEPFFDSERNAMVLFFLNESLR